MATNLPNKKIKKVKVPKQDGTTEVVEVIPERLQSSGYEVKAPADLTKDEVIATQSWVDDNAGTIRTLKVNNSTLTPDQQKVVTIVVGEAGGDGKYVYKIDEEAGAIVPAEKTFDQDFNNATNNNAPTTLAVKNYVDNNAGTIRTIRVNGTALIPDAQKAVDIIVPEVIDMR